MSRTLRAITRWFDSEAGVEHQNADGTIVALLKWLPLVVLHLGCLGILWVGWSWTAVAIAVALYFVRMFAITAFYHRYFSHRTFQTSRFMQFVFAVVGNTAAQRGPLWWAAHHRHHHRHADDEPDPHSPHWRGLWWSHVGWITARENFRTDYKAVPDLVKFPELVFLNRYDNLVPLLLAGALFGCGEVLRHLAPGLQTGGWQLVVWGFFVSTTVLFHGTCTINSLAHLMGRRRYQTDDHSRNSFLLALLTLGEGWHNNHHHYPGSARQGFAWWEVDITYYILKVMGWLGIIRQLNPVPQRILQALDRGSEASEP